MTPSQRPQPQSALTVLLVYEKPLAVDDAVEGRDEAIAASDLDVKKPRLWGQTNNRPFLLGIPFQAVKGR